ncbi:MAG: 50S ribosomal protein L5 [Candidatus Paceibacterota bacterium]|jgi:large subunit ribosomal protein L5
MTTKIQSFKEKHDGAFSALKEAFGYTNPMQAPHLVKAVINVGIGSLKDKKKIELIKDRIQKITGQKPASRAAKKSIATFKLREGEPVGLQVTLRGKRMFDFMSKLLNVSLPRTRDFRGVSKRSIDEMGNYTFGIKEHVIFPETADEDIKDVFGLAITVVTSASDVKVTEAFLAYLGFPFKKEEDTKRKGRKEKK